MKGCFSAQLRIDLIMHPPSRERWISPSLDHDITRLSEHEEVRAPVSSRIWRISCPGEGTVYCILVLSYYPLAYRSNQHLYILGEGFKWQKYLSAPVSTWNVRLTPRTTRRGVRHASRKTLLKSASPSASIGRSNLTWTVSRTTLSGGSQGSWRKGEGNSGAVRCLTGRTPFPRGVTLLFSALTCFVPEGGLEPPQGLTKYACYLYHLFAHLIRVFVELSHTDNDPDIRGI